jgi:iron complex outermembrane receptor protein
MNAAEALNRFAEQTGAIMLFPYDLASTRRANAVSGRYTLLKGLDLLLRDTGLSGGLSNKRVVNISPAGDAQRPSGEKVMPARNVPLGKKITAFVASIFSASVASGQDTGPGAQPLEEIVVTARKRAESLQDVPMSVTAIAGAELTNAGIENVENLYGRIPNLFAVVNGQNTASDSVYLMIRGVGFNGGQEPATGVFVDGVYQPQIGYDIGFLDLERLEVLRGPQGTLYGRNTQAGALNLVTKKPGEVLEGKFEVEAAEFGTYRTQASLRGPVSRTFFGGISAEYAESDGYIDNTTTGGDRNPYERVAVRGALRWLPSDAIEINLSADTAQKDYDEIGHGVPLSCECYGVSEDSVGDEKDLYGGSLTVDWDIAEAATLTSITGRRSVDSDITLDLDPFGSPAGTGQVSGIPGSVLSPDTVVVSGANYRTAFGQDIFSQELRLSGGVGDGIDYQLGAFYFEQSENYKRFWTSAPDTAIDPSLAFFLPFYAFQDLNQDRDGWAVFGQTSWRPTDRLELTLGGRYARETDELSGESNARLESIDTTILNVFDAAIFTDSFDSVTGLGSLSYRFNDDVLGYFTISEGWKAGGFNKLPEDFLQAYNDENSINYELGLKSQWLDNRAVVNVSVFYIDITDQQLSGTVFIDDLPRATITNAGKSVSQGLELELTGRLTDRLTVSGTLGYTDTEFKQYTDSDGNVRDGQSFPFVPDLTASAALEYVHTLGNDMDLEFSADYVHVSAWMDEDASFGGFGSFEIPATDRMDLRISLLNGGWRFTGYAKNVFDSYDINNWTPAQFFFPTPDRAFATPLPPRHFGLKVSRDF